jgi:hypothetical protein
MADIKYCVDCADCKHADPHQQPTSNKFRCLSPNAVGAHHPYAGEGPRPFGIELSNAPSCNEMRGESLVFETCGPQGRWHRNAAEKAEQEAARTLALNAALAEYEEAQRQAAAKAAASKHPV